MVKRSFIQEFLVSSPVLSDFVGPLLVDVQFIMQIVALVTFTTQIVLRPDILIPIFKRFNASI